MQLNTNGNNVEIVGNIKSVSDYQKIKQTLDNIVLHNSSISLSIVDSISITSSVIGYFNKLVLKDGVTLSISVGNDSLKELFDDLNLTNVFKVRRV